MKVTTFDASLYLHIYAVLRYSLGVLSKNIKKEMTWWWFCPPWENIQMS